MEIVFNISDDELPIFLAEVDEHLQVLDEILIRFDRGEVDPELVQTVFRSAHTIKGMCGMIGHRRMTELTHALETLLDKIRKDSLQISSGLVNLCLSAVDCMRLLRDEIVTGQVSDADVDEIVMALKEFSENSRKNPANNNEPVNQPLETGSKEFVQESEQAFPKNLQIQVKIDTNSMASAARAFQLMMALQDVGQIQSMTPTQEQIETSTSIRDFSAILISSQPFEKISAALTSISGIDEICIGGTVVLSDGVPVPYQGKASITESVSVSNQRGERFIRSKCQQRRLGEKKKYLWEAQFGFDSPRYRGASEQPHEPRG